MHDVEPQLTHLREVETMIVMLAVRLEEAEDLALIPDRQGVPRPEYQHHGLAILEALEALRQRRQAILEALQPDEAPA